MYLGYTKEEYNNLSNGLDMLIDYTIDKEALFNYEANGLNLNVDLINGFAVTFSFLDSKETRISAFMTDDSVIKSFCYSPDNKELGMMYFAQIEDRFYMYRKSNEEKDKFKSFKEYKKDGYLALSPQQSNLLKYFFDKRELCQKLLTPLFQAKITEKDIKEFVSKINISNSKQYLNLIQLNKKSIKEIIIASKQSENYGFDIFNLKKEDKEMLTLETDLNFDFNKEESVIVKQEKNKSFLDKFFNKNRG